jgi:hypothetical protein
MPNHDYGFTISYKGTDGKRKRTTGSVIANNIATAKRIIKRRIEAEDVKLLSVKRK